MSLLVVLGVILFIVAMGSVAYYFIVERKEQEEPDSKGMLRNHMKKHTDGHKMLKILDFDEGERRWRFFCTPRDLTRDDKMRISKGGKPKTYELFFNKGFVDLDISGKIPEFTAYPDKISDLSEADRNNPNIVDRVINGNKKLDMAKFYDARLEAQEKVGMSLAGGKLFQTAQKEAQQLIKDKIEITQITKKEEK